MAMTTAKWQQAYDITGDAAAGTGQVDTTNTAHLPRFVTGEWVYRFSDYTNAVSVIQKPYLLARESRVTDTDAYLDNTGIEANPTTYVKATRVDETLVAFFYDIISHRNGTTTDHVHQSDLATLAEIKTYIGTNAVGTWTDPV